MTNNVIMNTADISNIMKKISHMALMQQMIKTGHNNFSQHCSNTIVTLKHRIKICDKF